MLAVRSHTGTRPPSGSLLISSLAVKQGKRATTARARVVSGLVLAVAATLGAAACTSGQGTGSATSASSPSPAAYRPQLTVADARAAYATYVSTSDLAARTGDESLALSVLQGAAADTQSAAYKIADASHVGPPYSRYRYGTPTFYLPPSSAAGGPEYFVVSVARAPVAGTAPLVPSAQDVAADVQLPATGTVLMLFEKPTTSGAWQVSSISQVAPGESVPALATDSRGFVERRQHERAGDAAGPPGADSAPAGDGGR